MEKEDYSINEVLNMLSTFNNDPCVINWNERAKSRSSMEIFGVNRLEASHSDFLAWLLDSSNDHKLGAAPFSKFLNTVLVKDCSNNNLDDFLVGTDHITASLTKREAEASDGDRVDVLITAESQTGKRIRMILENKVLASETFKKEKGQTIRYYDHFSKLSDGFQNIFVYLNCDPSYTPEDNEHYVRLLYQDLVDSVIEPLLEMPGIPARTSAILEDYLLALEKPAKAEISNKKKDNIIMAIDSRQRDLLKKFWDTNAELIQAAASVVGEKEIAECVKKARRNQYDVNFDQKVYPSLGSAANDIIYRLFELSKPNSYKEFLDLLKEKTGHPHPINNKVKEEDDGRYNDPVRMCEEDVRISAGWVGTPNGNFQKLVEYAQTIKDFPSITYTARNQ